MKITLPALTDRQLEIVNGCLLGDGCVPNSKTGNCKFQIGMSVKSREYLESLSTEFGEWFGSLSDRRPNYFPYSILVCKAHDFWTYIRKIWYPNDKKIVPTDIKLTPLTLAHWYCGDGTNNSKRASCGIATNGFCKSDVDLLVDKLKDDFNIKARSCKCMTGVQLFIRSCSYLDFIDLITPYIEWDCFKYKIAITEWGRNHKHNSILWSFVDPTGIRYHTSSLVKFAKEHNLNSGCLCSLSKRRLKHHKGWTI